MTTTLLKAYRACLWLAERKLGIPVEEQRGEWDLEAKDSQFEWTREELISALPYEYFENSLYDYHADTSQEDEIEIQLEDLDTDIGLSEEDQILEAEVEEIFRDIQLDSSSLLANHDEEFTDESSTEIHCVDLSNIVSGPIFTTEQIDNFVRYSPIRTSGDITPEQSTLDSAETFPSIPQQILSIDDGSIDKQIKNIQVSKELASAIAHHTLLNLLRSGKVEAWGYRDIAYLPEVLTQGDEHQYSKEVIEPYFWHKKPVPNYEISAVEHGIHRGFKIAMATSDSGILYKDQKQISKYDYWVKNIQLNDSFQTWLMEKVRNEFPIPKRATFKPHGKGYLVQFGTDKEVEVKGNPGLKIIHTLLKNYCISEFRDDFGYSRELAIMDEYQEDVLDYEQATITYRKKPTNLVKYIRKQHNLIFWQLSLLKEQEYYQNQESIRNERTNEVPPSNEIDKNVIRKMIISRLNKVNRIAQNEVSCLDQKSLNFLFTVDPEDFLTNTAKYKETLKIPFTEEEKSIDNLRNTINASVKSIRKKAPHLAYFLGSAKSKTHSGIGYNNDLFYFVCKDDIEWDFG
ncbi:TPA: hypothetical protein ACX3GY_003729 [Vibrio parahaemolyticus]